MDQLDVDLEVVVEVLLRVSWISTVGCPAPLSAVVCCRWIELPLHDYLTFRSETPLPAGLFGSPPPDLPTASIAMDPSGGPLPGPGGLLGSSWVSIVVDRPLHYQLDSCCNSTMEVVEAVATARRNWMYYLEVAVQNMVDQLFQVALLLKL